MKKITELVLSCALTVSMAAVVSAGAADPRQEPEISFTEDEAGTESDISAEEEAEGTQIRFETKDLEGNPVSSKDLFSGYDVTMINLWATWCPPCKSELPELETLNQAFAEKNCQIIGIVCDAENGEIIEEAEAILEESGVTYVNLLPFDGLEETFPLYAFPTSFFVDETGTLQVEPVVGAYVEMYPEVIDSILALPSDASSDSAEAARVSYLGPEGTYTEEAAQFWFQNDEELIPEETVNDAVSAVQNGEADFAVIPQENTVGGAVVNYVDALIAADDTYVVGEVVLPISQTLMGVPGTELSEIQTVCSHAQGLTQSAAWREQNLPDAGTQEMDSTAAAASYVAEQKDPTIAAVAAPGAAALYGLEVLAENVQITDANKTRFYVLSETPLEEDGLTNAVFVATCDGSQIDDIILALHENDLEMVSIHDRPEGSSLGRYHYLIEVKSEEGISGEQIYAVCEAQDLRFAGCFDAAEKGTA